MIKLCTLLVSCLLLINSTHLLAECLSPEEAQVMVKQFPKKPYTNLNRIHSLDDAYCSQKLFVAALSESLGPVNGKQIGYKVGFTGKDGQKKFGIPHPAMGVLMQGMMIENQSKISADFGYRPMIEPDLMVIVKNDAIMQASTIKEVAQHLDTLHAFIEIPTILFPSGKPFTANQLVAINVGATRMVMGEGISVETTDEFLSSLPQAQTTFIDASGKLIQAAPLKNLMEHPFNAILWLIPELKKHGLSLKQGDHVSLGAVGKLFPVNNTNNTFTYKIDLPNQQSLNAQISVIQSQ